ncbi:PLP-dependent aminotransferase family protein [Rubrivivax gelatinosus]|uniref:hypothetical protein n=1 Tax=Rubrivivax gelatinosus TaxID=28068 RepID=UPI001F5BD4B6|nr:hypothetical protein [Rubrivivax gelatinosus]
MDRLTQAQSLAFNPEPAPARVHGGPGRDGAAAWDFSTCANAAGPCPQVLDALQRVDPCAYPDPGYHALRERLADWHRVPAGRILFAASASEFIQRVSAVGARLMPGAVAVPRHAYGDYTTAARAAGRAVLVAGAGPATLRWVGEPSSPRGQDAAPPPDPQRVPTVLDGVYAPLRLQGASRWNWADRQAVFVLHGPNKALGLCGLRGAYVVAPDAEAVDWDAAAWMQALAAAEPVLQRHPGAWLWLLSDGRCPGEPPAPRAAAQVVIVDHDDGPVSIGRCAAWAEAWGARWVPANRFDGERR